MTNGTGSARLRPAATPLQHRYGTAVGWVPPLLAATHSRKRTAPLWPDGPVYGMDESHHRFYWGTELMLVCGKGFAGTDFAADMAELGITAVLPARRDEEDPGGFPAWLRQRIEAGDTPDRKSTRLNSRHLASS